MKFICTSESNHCLQLDYSSCQHVIPAQSFAPAGAFGESPEKQLDGPFGLVARQCV